MADQISLEAVANQSLTVLLDGQSYLLDFRLTLGSMAVSISINDAAVVSGSQFTADAPLIPYAHLEGDGGNFIFETEGDALPDFTEFGLTQFLFYITAAELADARS